MYYELTFTANIMQKTNMGGVYIYTSFCTIKEGKLPMIIYLLGRINPCKLSVKPAILVLYGLFAGYPIDKVISTKVNHLTYV